MPWQEILLEEVLASSSIHDPLPMSGDDDTDTDT